jgi:hypothetical protein
MTNRLIPFTGRFAAAATRSRLGFAACSALWLVVGWAGALLWSIPWVGGGVGWVAQSVVGAWLVVAWLGVGVAVCAGRWGSAGLPVGVVRSVGGAAAVVALVFVLGPFGPWDTVWDGVVRPVVSNLYVGLVALVVGCWLLGLCLPARDGHVPPPVHPL